MSENGHIVWTNERRKLSDLIPWERNPRQIKKDQAKRLAESLAEFSQPEPLAIGPGDEVYNGHQRLAVWAEKYGPDLEVDVRVSSRPLTEKEREKLTIYLHQGAAGEWDFDALANEFELDELLAWGFEKRDLDLELWAGIDAHDRYSRNIESPIYTPQGEKPGVGELFDDTKARALIAEIDAADLPDEEKEFLRVAARRHTVLNYQRIADYYAHSSKDVQRLMENSALVIIDFGRAIELGYVRVAEGVANQYRVDYGD